MKFLKELFGDGTLTYDQLEEKVSAAGMSIVNAADGAYMSRDKYNDKVNALNGQIKDLQGQLTQRDSDTMALQEQLTAAQGDAGKLAGVQQSLTDLQSKYDADTKAWEKKVNDQAYEFAVKEKAGDLNFSSKGVKADFVSKAIAAGLKLDGGTLLGFDDFVAKYKADDPGAFLPDKSEDPASAPKPPQFVAPPGPGPAPQSTFGFHFNGVRPAPKQG